MTELERLRDSLARVGGKVFYTVQVIGAGGSGINKSIADIKGSGIEGVTVTISQLGIVETSETNEFGMVSFSDLRVGKIAVNVSLAGYTSASFIAELQPANTGGVSANTERSAASLVPIFALTGTSTATISGIITHESDLTNKTSEPVSGLAVSASIVVDNTFMNTYINPTVGTAQWGTGQITKISYGEAVITGTTNATGEYSLTVPTTANGLPLRLNISDLAINQTLLLNQLRGSNVFGPQTLRAVFTPNSAGAVTPSQIPTVRPAYIVIDAPTGTVGATPTTPATADAVISNGQLVSIHITNGGQGYTQTPEVKINSSTGIGATATAVVASGRIIRIDVTNAGQNYLDATVDLSETGGSGAAATATVTYGVKTVNVTSTGSGYSSAPSVTFSGANGSGATAVANLVGYVNIITVTNQGVNYTQVPPISITGGGGSGATATATLTGGVVRVISLPAQDNAWFTVAPSVTFSGGSEVTAAIATSTLASTGRIGNITITNGGSGYTSIPTVTFTGGGGSGAVANAILSGEVVVGINIINRGSDYTSVPTITISGGGGTGATATVNNIQKRVASVTLNSGGYYNGIPTAWFDGTYSTSVLMNRSISQITVNNNGIGYTSEPTITIGGDGVGATASASLLSVVNSVTVTNAGSNYTGSPTITFTGGGGSGAAASATTGYGVVSNVIITNPGSGYTAAPNFVLSGGGSVEEHAVLTGIVSGGQVTGATIVNPGRNYTANPSVAVNTYKTLATATPNISIGSVVGVNITNQGLGYTTPPIIVFRSTNNVGNGATGTATLDAQGRIERINITDGGAGYTTAPAVDFVLPNLARTAKADVTVNTDGVVTSVTVTDGGAGYVAVPNVIISPATPGAGLNATAIARITNGAVSSIVLTNGGSGYFSQNRPGNYFPTSGAGSVGGSGVTYSHSTGANVLMKSSVSVVNDVYLGTGKREVEY
jgi:hypothetical protein